MTRLIGKAPGRPCGRDARTAPTARGACTRRRTVAADERSWSPDVTRRPAASLTVRRQSTEDVQERQVIVSVDGEPFGTLLFGQTVTRPIEPGAHYVRFNNTLVWKTVEFEVSPGERVEFEVVNRSGFATKAFVTMLGVGPLYLTVRRST